MGQLRLHASSETPDVILCGNKCDLEEDRAVNKKEALDMAERYNFKIILFREKINSQIMLTSPDMDWSTLRRPRTPRRAGFPTASTGL
jgi:GTPase SAR1 family protein